MNALRISVGLSGLALLVGGSQMTMAGLFAQQAQRQIDAWHAAAQAPAGGQWLLAHNAARKAVAWYPVAQGDYLDRLGRVESWAAVGQPPAGAESAHRAALEHYRQALAVRPNWPYTWVGLVESKVALRQFDGELDHAFKHALALGPWRIGVNRDLARIGLQAWPQLNPAQRLVTLQSVSRAAAFSVQERQQVLVLAEQNDLLAVVCRSLAAHKIKPSAACAAPPMQRAG